MTCYALFVNLLIPENRNLFENSQSFHSHTLNNIEMFGFGTPTFVPDRDIPELTGKVILVTGGKH